MSKYIGFACVAVMLSGCAVLKKSELIDFKAAKADLNACYDNSNYLKATYEKLKAQYDLLEYSFRKNSK